jgi:hypothetical protein
MVKRRNPKGQRRLHAGVVITSGRRNACDQHVAATEELAVQTQAKVADWPDFGRAHVQKANRTCETWLRNESTGRFVVFRRRSCCNRDFGLGWCAGLSKSRARRKKKCGEKSGSGRLNWHS